MMKRKVDDGNQGGWVLDTEDLEHFKRNGYVVVDNTLHDDQLQAFREECNQLYEETTPDEVVELGCVLDIFASGNRSTESRCDVSMYKKLREKHLGRPSNPQVLHFIFEQLPMYMRVLFKKMHEDFVYFFNEHYVVKPPTSKVEFRWHQDDAEQLGMCVHREHIPWYLSAWVALDDITFENGALQFRDDDGNDLPPVLISAGSMIIFRSDVWHYSAPNTTESIRRAFYVQYTSVPITAGPNSSTPLCCAIPIATTSNKKLIT